MTIAREQTRGYLQQFQFSELFVEELGWDNPTGPDEVVDVDGTEYLLTRVAEKRGVQVFSGGWGPDGQIPDYPTRRKIERAVTDLAYEHLIIFTDRSETTQVWQWVRREPGVADAVRHETYYRGQSGDRLLQALEQIRFTLDEEEALTISAAVDKLRKAFDKDKVTKSFYKEFSEERTSFEHFIEGIAEQGDRAWYASLMLNRLMFVYFFQQKGFLDGDRHYLQNRLKRVQAERGRDQFHTFYREFLRVLFRDGLGTPETARSGAVDTLIGDVPYLNGGIFDEHQLEQMYPEIDIPDSAFEKIFAFFDQYQWHLDERPIAAGNEINPDVLGYIFEKYINQKELGAYYTKEDITEYIGKNTIIPYLFDTAKEEDRAGFRPDAYVWQLLAANPEDYIYDAVKHGIVDKETGNINPIPEQVADGWADVSKREGWNQRADPAYGLPTETWREYVARRKRFDDVWNKLVDGEVTEINDLITLNLDIRRFAEDTINTTESPDVVRAFYKAIRKSSVLDPTCGSGAFLFAALNILEPLYTACLRSMRRFVEALDASGVQAGPLKFSDFRKWLAEAEQHENERYFILKQIVLHNLYGVDIVEEAVEICKLRLFLKLVAQLERKEEIEPLPDIDFNIRCGNTLVGFARREDVKQALKPVGRDKVTGAVVAQAGLEFVDEMARIEEAAELADKAFERFHDMQSDHQMGSSEFRTAKKELNDRLAGLRGELNAYLAREYTVTPGEGMPLYEQWLSSHQPFHWFAEFYGIMKDGGFDVIIGNPPYVEYSKVRKNYRVIDYVTEPTGNIYAMALERSIKLSSSRGTVGMIVPLAFSATERMRLIREFVTQQCSMIWVSHLSGDANPSILFEGVKLRLNILIGCKGELAAIKSSPYLKWFKEERSSLFARISYDPVNPSLVHRSLVPKLANATSSQILLKTSPFSPLAAAMGSQSAPIYVHRVMTMFIKCFDFVPFFSNSIDGVKKSEDYKLFRFLDQGQANVALSVISSSTFFHHFVAYGDCFHCGKEFVENFPVGLQSMNKSHQSQLTRLGALLMEDMKNNAVRKRAKSVRTGTVEYDEFWPKYSKAIIDEIDRVLAKHYVFTDEELDFIINYDIKYRMGAD
jgi:hypothetical protein